MLTSELERLGNLYERKLFTDEEFAQAEARVLEHSASRPVQAPVAAAPASPVSSGFQKADEGTRTLDLLHGKGWRAFAPVRSGSLKPLVCSGFGSAERTAANPSERRVQPLQPL
jgi:hypothetical protein